MVEEMLDMFSLGRWQQWHDDPKLVVLQQKALMISTIKSRKRLASHPKRVLGMAL